MNYVPGPKEKLLMAMVFAHLCFCCYDWPTRVESTSNDKNIYYNMKTLAANSLSLNLCNFSRSIYADVEEFIELSNLTSGTSSYKEVISSYSIECGQGKRIGIVRPSGQMSSLSLMRFQPELGKFMKVSLKNICSTTSEDLKEEEEQEDYSEYPDDNTLVASLVTSRKPHYEQCEDARTLEHTLFTKAINICNHRENCTLKQIQDDAIQESVCESLEFAPITTINYVCLPAPGTFRTLKFNFGHYPESDTLCAAGKSVYLRKSSLMVVRLTPPSATDTKNLNDCNYSNSNTIVEPEDRHQSVNSNVRLGKIDIRKSTQCLEEMSLLPFENCHGTSFCHLNLKNEVKYSLLGRSCQLHYFNMSTSRLEVEYSCIDDNSFADDKHSISDTSREQIVVKLNEASGMVHIVAFNNRDYDYQELFDKDSHRELISVRNNNISELRNSAANLISYSIINLIVTLIAAIVFEKFVSN